MNAAEAPAGLITRQIADRQRLLRNEMEDWLRAECLARAAAPRPEPDYGSVEGYLGSVAEKRERWRETVGEVEGPAEPGEPLLEPWLEDEVGKAWYVTLPWRGNLRLRGVLGLPKKRRGRLPLVLAQHGLTCSPERVFGFDPGSHLYHGYGRRLMNDGYAVFAPLHLTLGPPRARIHRLCLMLGRTIHGFELSGYHALLDWLVTCPEIDPERVAIWGISMGGVYTLFTTPLEPRLKVAIVTAFFNHRARKMVLDDPRQTCFLSTAEEHIFVPGWLTEFCDFDLAALICPRPLMVQTGKADGIGWWPWIGEEIERAREPYERLGIGERLVWDRHEAGHEIRYHEGRAFLERWLT